MKQRSDKFRFVFSKDHSSCNYKEKAGEGRIRGQKLRKKDDVIVQEKEHKF